MSTFTSAWPKHPRRINIDERADGANIFISDPLWDDEYGITIAPSDAPALALAILEAAGYSEDDRKVSNPLYATEFAGAMIKLAEGIEAQERITAEAKEQAELEAEAFKLRRAYLEGRAGFDSWNELTDAERDHWLAVARKAREIAKEAPSA